MDLAGGPYVLNRRIHQDPSHSRPCNVFRDVQASELRGPRGDVVLLARQHVRVANDKTSLLRDEDGEPGRSSASPWAKSAVVSSTDMASSSASGKRSR